MDRFSPLLRFSSMESSGEFVEGTQDVAEDAMFPQVFEKWSGPQGTFVIHAMYRQEMIRLVQYQLRLDRTVQWAVIGSTTLIGFILKTESIHHAMFVLIALILFACLFIDSRRSVYLEQSRKRIETVEKLFFASILIGEHNTRSTSFHPSKLLYHQCREAMLENVESPNYFREMRTRFYQDYVYLFIAVYLGWVYKLVLAGFERVTFGAVTAVIVVIGVVLLLLMKTKWKNH
eukprot:m.3311 g.3311  ORF g.3311 m.3311 type:complete len:232 (+) comp3386_c0_seq1:88-783(+)